MRVFLFILLLGMCCSLVAAEPESPRWCIATPCALIHPSFYLYRKCCSCPPKSSVTTPPPPAVPKSPPPPSPPIAAHNIQSRSPAPTPEAHEFKAPWWCRYMPRLPCNTIRFEHGLISAKCCGLPAGTLQQSPPSASYSAQAPTLQAAVLHETPCPNNSSSYPAAIFSPDPTMCFEQRMTSTKCEVHKKSENSFQRSIRCCTDTTYIGKECSSPNNMTRTTKTECTVDGVLVPPPPSEPPVEAQPSPAPPPSGTPPNSPPPSEPPVEAQPSSAPPPSGTPPNSPPPSEPPVEGLPSPAPPPNSPPPPSASSEAHIDCYPPVIENQAAAIRGMCCITRVANGEDCSGPVRKPYRTVHTDCHPAKNGFCYSG